MSTHLWEDDSPKSRNELRDLGNLVALVLYRIATQKPNPTAIGSIFYSRHVPKISIESYIQRFIKYLELGEAELIALLIFVDRYIKKTQESFNLFNGHKLIATGFIIAQKFFSDEPFLMSDYAQVSGLSVAELASCERELLKNLDFALFITLEEYLLYKTHLVTHARNIEGMGIGPYAIALSAAEKEFCESNNLSIENPSKESYIVGIMLDKNFVHNPFLPPLKPLDTHSPDDSTPWKKSSKIASTPHNTPVISTNHNYRFSCPPRCPDQKSLKKNRKAQVCSDEMCIK